MKILEFMSFNPEWFLTVPGVLITGGVILLVIALIILITSGNKNEEDVIPPPIGPIEITPDAPEVKNDVSNAQINEPTLQNEYQTVNETQNVQPEPAVNSVPSYTTASEAPVSNPEPVVVPPFMMNEQPPIEENVTPINTQFTSNQGSDINVEQTIPAQQNTGFGLPTETMSNFFNAQPEPAAINPEPQMVQPEPAVINPEPAIIQPVEQNMVEPVNTQPKTPPVSIYGGVSPSVNFFEQPQVKPIIYGGADPLENTSPIPKVEQQVNEFPNNIYSEAPIENNVASEPMIDQVTPPVDIPVQSEPKQPEVVLQEQPTPGIINNVNDIETLDF